MNFSIFSLFFIGQLILCSIGVQSAQATKSKYDQVKSDLFYFRSINTSNIIDRVLSHNWTQNHECLTELKAIKTGLENHEEWALRGRQVHK